MSSREVESPTEDMEDSESQTVKKELSGAMAEENEKDDARNDSPPEYFTDHGDGGHPSEQAPVDHQTGVTLGDSLPEEVWKDVFDTLDSSDKLTCFRTTSKWRDWLGPKRTLLLFPEVASSLFSLNDPTLTECRKMCKSWKEVVDSQAHQSLVLLSFEKGGADDSRTVVFETVEKIRQFWEDMKSHPGNPFPWRSIKVCWCTGQQLRLVEPGGLEAYFLEYINKLIQLLQAFGHYIYHVLLRVPNLRKLEISLDTDDYLEAEYIAEILLPQLFHLETLKLDGRIASDVIPIFCSCVAPQSIKRMEIEGFFEAIYDFQNLEVFKGGCYVHLEDLERFRNAAHRPPFKKLVIEVNTYEVGVVEQTLDFQRLFVSLALFADSLEYLHASAWEKRVPLILRDMDFRINFPKLKCLRLGNFDGSLDTLIELTSLSDLDVEFATGMWDRATLTVLGIQKQMNESNIWELIPSLNTLIVREWNEKGGRKFKRDSSTGIIVEVEDYDFDSDTSHEEEGSESNEDDEEENESESNSQMDTDEGGARSENEDVGRSENESEDDQNEGLAGEDEDGAENI